MKDNIRVEVMALLTNYHEIQRRIALLHYEMEHPAHITADDMIDVLTYGRSENQGGSTGHISNKTLYIALNYRDRSDYANNDVCNEIAIQLNELERKLDRLHYYLGLLSSEDREIIQMAYIENMSNEKIAERIGIHIRTVFKRRMKAIDHLCEMYAFAADFHHDHGAEKGQNAGSKKP